jgi:hypothetical protein
MKIKVAISDFDFTVPRVFLVTIYAFQNQNYDELEEEVIPGISDIPGILPEMS